VSVNASLWTPAYIAIGSNLDGPVAQVEAAFVELTSLPQSRFIARSRLYRSAPLGPKDQPEFVNAAAGLLTQLTARELWRALRAIEARMGRAPPIVRWGARRIDLDLLVHGESRIHDDDLTIPHRGVPSRNFVLYPLCDIAPTLLIPGHGRASVLAKRVGSNGLAAIK
jgi:2-amino-4-hydroxy-6-hydroxymethyldihydropteridine diphosphokinase